MYDLHDFFEANLLNSYNIVMSYKLGVMSFLWWCNLINFYGAIFTYLFNGQNLILRLISIYFQQKFDLLRFELGDIKKY